jgi:hypothetical protein
MNYFDDSAVKLDILKQRAFNGRWAEVPDGVVPLTAADPDFQVAPQIIDAMKEYLDGAYFPRKNASPNPFPLVRTSVRPLRMESTAASMKASALSGSCPWTARRGACMLSLMHSWRRATR